MGSCKDSKQMELYKILKTTKYDHTNKALMTYYSSGMTPQLNEFFSSILRANIPIEDTKPLALILYNSSRNGRSVIPGYQGGYIRNWRGVAGWKDKISEDTEFVCMVYNKVRKSTLKRWREAILLIDINKSEKKFRA